MWHHWWTIFHLPNNTIFIYLSAYIISYPVTILAYPYPAIHSSTPLPPMKSVDLHTHSVWKYNFNICAPTVAHAFLGYRSYCLTVVYEIYPLWIPWGQAFCPNIPDTFHITWVWVGNKCLLNGLCGMCIPACFVKLVCENSDDKYFCGKGHI